MAIAIVPPVIMAGAFAARMLRNRRRRIMLVGLPGSGKTTLAALLGEPNHPGPSTAIPIDEMHGRLLANGPPITIIDMAGTSALSAWKAAIDRQQPHLICVLIDFSRLIEDDGYLEDAERTASHVKAMAGRRRSGVVLTHTEPRPDAEPVQVRPHPRSRLLSNRLGSQRLTAGSLLEPEEALTVFHDVRSWLR